MVSPATRPPTTVTAIQRSVAFADDISVESMLAAHEALLAGQGYADPGRFRTAQVWIGGYSTSLRAATFVPAAPQPAAIGYGRPDRLRPPHRRPGPGAGNDRARQVETIHPFNDGNGRIGRTLVHAMLPHADVTRRLTVPVSAGLLADTSAYFRALTSCRDGDVEPVIRQFSAASFRAVDNGRHLIDDLDAVYHSWAIGSRRDAVLPPGGCCRPCSISPR